MSNNRPGGDNPDGFSRTPQPDWKWKKASFSTSNGDCIEVAPINNNHVGVRDSKVIADPYPYLRFPIGAWTAFTDDIRRDFLPSGTEPVL